MENPEQEIEQEVRNRLPAMKKSLEQQARLIERAHRSGIDVTEMRKKYTENKSAVQKMENEWIRSH